MRRCESSVSGRRGTSSALRRERRDRRSVVPWDFAGGFAKSDHSKNERKCAPYAPLMCWHVTRHHFLLLCTCGNIRNITTSNIKLTHLHAAMRTAGSRPRPPLLSTSTHTEKQEHAKTYGNARGGVPLVLGVSNFDVKGRFCTFRYDGTRRI